MPLAPQYPATRYDPSPLVDFSVKDERERLSRSALRALLNIMQRWEVRDEDARALLGDLFRCNADLYPDEATGVLEVRVHTRANPRSNRAIRHLLDQLNAAESTYPGTNLRLTYTLAPVPET